MEMSLPGISNHRLGYFSKVGRKQCWWPSELPELLRVVASRDTVRIRFLLLTTVSGTTACCGCTGGLWDSGIWDYNGRGEVQVLPERRCLRVTSCGLHVPGPCASLHSAGVPVNPSQVCMEFLASNREGAIRTLGLFIMVSEQAQLSSLHIYYITPTEESRRKCLQMEMRWAGNTEEENQYYFQVEYYWLRIIGSQRILEMERSQI